MKKERVIREALELPEPERARLVDRLIASLEMDGGEGWGWGEDGDGIRGREVVDDFYTPDRSR